MSRRSVGQEEMEMVKRIVEVQHELKRVGIIRTASEFAAVIGVTDGNWDKYKRGVYSFSAMQVLRMLTEYPVRADYLFKAEGPPLAITPELETVLSSVITKLRNPVKKPVVKRISNESASAKIKPEKTGNQ